MNKKYLTAIIDRMGLRKYVSAARAKKNALSQTPWYRDRQVRRWVGQCRKQNALVHPTIEFEGRLPAHHVHIGAETCIQRDVSVWLAPDANIQPVLAIGTDSFVGRNTFFGVYEPITIGSHVQIAAYCYLVSQNHGYARRDIPIKYQDFVGKPIIIEDDVWLGTHVVILPGVTIGQGAIVAAGSVVNRNIPPYQIWGGAPAKFIKDRPT